MADTLLAQVHEDRTEAGAPATARTEPALFLRSVPLELETTRVRLAEEMFGVALAAPQIGRFRVLEKLGEGAMGEVYAAFDPELDRRVAIKVLHAAHGETYERRERLIREAQALARVSHPNVVQVFEVGMYKNHVFVAMEYVRGESLAAWLAGPDAPRPWPIVLSRFIAAAHGLAAVHATGLVHRDFKPANAILGEDGRVRILDFGLAKIAAPGDAATPVGDAPVRRLDPTLTAAGSILGTPAYMAPEVFLGQPADARSDQYSFCAALYEALYGIRPHSAETLYGLAQAKLAGSLVPPPSGRRAPGWLHAAVVRGLSVAPEKRWPSMAIVLAELQQDRQAGVRRWAGVVVVLALLALVGFAIRQGRAEQRIAADERVRAELAERDAAGRREEAERAAFERGAMAEAERAGEVLRLAQTRGRERDALILGVQALEAYAPDFREAPALALEGVARALASLIPARTLPGRGERILDLALDPDGRTLAAADAGKRISLWNVDDGTLRHSIAWPRDIVTLAFNADGSRLLAVDERCTLLDPTTGTAIGGKALCRHATFSPDGTAVHLAHDATLRALDSADGRMLWAAPAAAAIEALQVDPHGRILAAALADGRVQLHDPADGRQLAVLRLRERVPSAVYLPGLSALSFSPDGSRLAVSGRGLHLWDVPARRSLPTLVQPNAQTAFMPLFSLDAGRLLALGHHDFRVFDAATGALQTITPGMTSWDTVVLDDGHLLGTTLEGGLERLMDDGRPFDYAPADAPDIMPLELAVSANHARAATGRDEIKLWNLGDPRRLGAWFPPAGTRSVVPAGPVVASDVGAAILLHDRRTGAVIARIADTDPGTLHAVHIAGGNLWSRRGDLLRIHAIADGRVSLHEPRTWATDRSWFAPLGSPRLVTIAADGQFDVFDTATGRRRCSIIGEGEALHPNFDPASAHPRLALARDGRLIAVPVGDSQRTPLVAGLTGAIRISIWSTDACTAQTVIVLPFAGAVADPLVELAFAEDGSLVTRLGATTFVHDPTSGQQRFRADERCTSQSYLTEGMSELSPDGTKLLTTCNGRATVWWLSGEAPAAIDITAGRSDYQGSDDYANGLRRSFFSDGERVLLPTASGDLIVWDLEREAISTRLEVRGPFFHHASVTADGEHIEHHGAGDYLTTYVASRSELITAACRALAATEAAPVAASACSRVSP